MYHKTDIFDLFIATKSKSLLINDKELIPNILNNNAKILGV